MQKQMSDDRLYAVTDDDATIAFLLKCMRDMDPDGVGIVRSEFKKYTLSHMHTGNMRQNHRLWRRLQTKMQKQGVLELDVHTVSTCCSCLLYFSYVQALLGPAGCHQALLNHAKH